MKKKHHCKRESENIQYNELNNIVERVIHQIIIFFKYFKLSPLWGKIGVVGRVTIGFP